MMSLTALLCYAAGAYTLFWIVDFLYGQRLRVILFPKRYAVWAGTQAPPPVGLDVTYREIKSFVFSKGVDLLDVLFESAFETAGYTAQQEPKFFVTADPPNIQAMLATQFKDFDTGSLRRLSLGPFLGRSIFTSDGDFWEHSRALFRPQFSRENINDLEATEKASEALIAACGDTTNGWLQVALSPLFYNFTLDTATEFLFGESLDSQDVAIRKVRGDENGEAVASSQQFVEAMEIISTTLLWRMRASIWYFIMDSPKFRRALRFIKSWAKKYVEAALEKPMPKRSVLSALATQCKDEDELRNQTLAILFAGRDTTASLLGWIFVRLSLNPDVYQKLREIVLAEFPIGARITFSQIKSCRYLQHIISETLRLHPTVPVNIRVATRHTTLPVGGGPDGSSPIPIRKGSMIAYSVYFMHRRKDLWGEDALEYKPERWERKVPAWHYLPFSGGPRICLGQQFALTEAGYMLIKMAQRFDVIEPVDWEEMAKMRREMGITLAVKDQVRVRMHKAEQ
ncbi:hypothetical protein AMS68_000103 [Peltaster fructicola]|uniref:Cytochrome P450 n=1 Tax=Peltaster fructicola TaxID=286661 RepID=A0A6H0XIP1_9PEZI|nr:hypothetical protein AMS68_000103 [Peltaster fructicola]